MRGGRVDWWVLGFFGVFFMGFCMGFIFREGLVVLEVREFLGSMGGEFFAFVGDVFFSSFC